jgi:tetratricopeptide (TPR) repeat protein
MSKRKRKAIQSGARSAARPVTWLPPSSGSTPSGGSTLSSGRTLWICIALVALNLVVFAEVRHFEFVNWDDPSYITENTHVQQGLTWQSAKWAVTTAYSPYWHPVTWLSHLADVRLFGLDAGAHHVVNLVIHIADTLLLFGVFCLMTRATGPSAFVAAMFGIHPLHVESVAWVTERKDVLSALFWMLTIWAYVRYVSDRSAPRYVAVLVLYGLALMSKPMVVTLPIVLMLLDVWPLNRFVASAFRRKDVGGADSGFDDRSLPPEGGSHMTLIFIEKLPLIALAVATGIATMIVQKRVGAMATLEALSWADRCSNAIVGYVEYVWKTIWPVRLAAFYPFRDYPAVVVLLAAAALTAATALALSCRKRAPYVFTGWLWYVITLAPVSGVLQAGEQRIADRFSYIPMIGLLVIVAWGVPQLLARFAVERRAAAVLATLVVLLSTVVARAQTAHWADSLALWDHAVRVTPDNYIAHENLGQALRERARLDEALASYERALTHAPARSPAYRAVIHNSLGLVLTRLGKTDQARVQFEAAVKTNPVFAEPRSNLANTLAVEGRFDEAAEHYRAAVDLKPDFTEALVGLGNTLLRKGDAAEAAAHYREALRLNPSLAEAHNGLGAALARQGLDEEAMAQYQEALRLRPDMSTAHFNFAVLLAKAERTDEARRHLETALALDPNYHDARRALDILSIRR